VQSTGGSVEPFSPLSNSSSQKESSVYRFFSLFVSPMTFFRWLYSHTGMRSALPIPLFPLGFWFALCNLTHFFSYTPFVIFCAFLPRRPECSCVLLLSTLRAQMQMFSFLFLCDASFFSLPERLFWLPPPVSKVSRETRCKLCQRLFLFPPVMQGFLVVSEVPQILF